MFRVDRCTTSLSIGRAGVFVMPCLRAVWVMGHPHQRVSDEIHPITRKEHAKSCLVYREGNKIRDITWELTSNGVLSCHIKDIISDTKVVCKLSALVLECPCLLCWANFRALL